MPEEKYITIGQRKNTNQYMGGILKAYGTLLENRFKVKGRITRDNIEREIEGMASHEHIDNTLCATLLLFEYPIKEGANNTIYMLNGEFQIDQKKQKLLNGIRELNANLEGRYSGGMFQEATIMPLDPRITAEYKDIAVSEFIFPEIDFDPAKEIPITFTLEKN